MDGDRGSLELTGRFGVVLQRASIHLTWLAVLAACVLVGAVLVVGLQLSKPATAVVGPPPLSLGGAERVAFVSDSGAMLQGWWVPPRTPGHGMLLLLHGVRGNRTAMLSRAEVLVAQGFGVLLFDFQAHGESQGARITFGARESLDVEAAARLARLRAPGARLGAIGVSLGGAAAILTRGTRLDALILESVYPEIDSALANRLRTGLGTLGRWTVPILMPIFERLMPFVLDVTPSDLRPIDSIGAVKAPLLLLSGSVDTSTPLNEAHALFNHAAEPKAFHVVVGAGHVDLERFDPATYWAVTIPFLRDHLVRQD